MNDPRPHSLDDALGKIRLDVAPPRNLWPDIARRLNAAPRRARPMALAAAAVVGACMAGALTWAVLHGRAAAPPEAPALQTAARAAGFDEPRNASYVAARESLELSFRERLALLDPVTRARIEASLAVIQKAHEDIRQALAGDPASPVLEQLWQSTWRDELDLYDTVVRGTQPTMTRT